LCCGPLAGNHFAEHQPGLGGSCQALRWSFVGVLTMAVLTLIATWLIPVTQRSAPSGQTAAHAPQAASR
jgi:hypothetical protein